jgi:hypothetical protein
MTILIGNHHGSNTSPEYHGRRRETEKRSRCCCL